MRTIEPHAAFVKSVNGKSRDMAFLIPLCKSVITPRTPPLGSVHGSITALLSSSIRIITLHDNAAYRIHFQYPIHIRIWLVDPSGIDHIVQSWDCQSVPILRTYCSTTISPKPLPERQSCPYFLLPHFRLSYSLISKIR